MAETASTPPDHIVVVRSAASVADRFGGASVARVDPVCVKTQLQNCFGGRLTLGALEEIAPSAFWRLALFLCASKPAFSHGLDPLLTLCDVNSLPERCHLDLGSAHVLPLRTSREATTTKDGVDCRLVQPRPQLVGNSL